MSKEKDQKKAKVTPETKAESERLKAIWLRTSDRLSQAEFGEKFDIGSQSAVTLFLNGRTPLSLKAARGFAKGLGCAISEFSERLAKEADKFGEMSSLETDGGWPFMHLDKARFDALEEYQKIEIQGVIRTMIEKFEIEQNQTRSKRSR